MSYSTITNILPMIPKLPQSTTASGYSVTVNIVGKHITRADALVDSYVSKRYSLPFSNVPPIVRAISEDITAYYTFRSFFTQDNSNKTDYFAELKDDAMATLKMIGDGDLQLVNTAGSIIEFLSNFEVDSTHNHQPFFDIDNSTDWEFNTDLLDSVKDGR